MSTSNQIVIIGGGIIGLACAHYLQLEGASVTVVDRSKVGTGASHGNCGILYFTDFIPLCSPGAVSHEIIRTFLGTSPLYIKPEADFKKLFWLLKFAAHCRPSHMSEASRKKYALLEYSARLFDTLFQSQKLACDYHSQGVLSVFKEAKNLSGFAKTNQFISRFCPAYEKLSRQEVCERFPSLREDVAGGWLHSWDSHLRPDYLMSSWKSNLESRGVRFMENTNVRGLVCDGGGRVTAIDTDKGRLLADASVLAAGAWSPELGKTLKINVPVQPGKGYSITMERPVNCAEIPMVLCESNMVVTPWDSGYRLGGTMEFSGYDMTLSRTRLNKLVAGAKAYLKDPVGTPMVEEWTSLRPMTYDDLPIIDRAPGHDNLIIATGHGMLGLTLATGTGHLVTDLLMERRPEVLQSDFSLARF